MEEIPGPANEPVQILIVDGTTADRDFLASIVRGQDREVVSLASGTDAMDYLRQRGNCALVLLDVQTPVSDGYATARALRTHSAAAEIPIIFVTASAYEEQRIFQAYDAGAVDFLFRPIDAHILRSKVDVFCRLHAQKQIIRVQLEEISKQHAALHRQLEEIRVLRGLLPICASCKSVRNDTGFWEAIESYLQSHTEVAFSHGLCPDCTKRLYPELQK